MHTIIKADASDAKTLSKLSKETFLVPHGHSAPKEEINTYINHNFNVENFVKELNDEKNIYHLIIYNNIIVGFSKVILNSECKHVKKINVALLSRIYLLKEYYDLSLGKALFNFNISLAKNNKQSGVWLAVWIENHRAISFYKKMGFKRVGNYDFKISENHSNPNHILYLEF